MQKKYCLLFLSLVLLQFTSAQKNQSKKYQSLLWEITGNGLKKPSYLFGTMHVSSKVAFHLSDSFYSAIKSVDAVALELNPDVWQGQMSVMDKMKISYANYIKTFRGNFISENSFRLRKYDDQLKLALSTEPAVVNNLLYRSYKTREDFEEDTFLDLYIFQTGKKLGKRGTGVENYYETEKIVMEAYGDMAAEKKKKTVDTDGESYGDIAGKIEDAYKRGDLDLMDSLDNIMEQSAAFKEKFLYLRNEIQANSIDSIIKKSALFVGVGSAHLPGPRGVIELLRKKGYSLRPVKMADRDALQKEHIDNLKVPVVFNSVTSDDGFYKVDVPGELFEVYENYMPIDRRQYSDMSNGSFYQVTRVRTHAAFVHETEEDVRKKIDSLLYENIPGKIIKKTVIQRNGYSGYDISSRTRRGDLQRYHIFITPTEVLVFKMSGKENYVSGKEAQQFFSSITFKERNNTPLVFSPVQGGFTVKLPQQPAAWHNTKTADDNNTWEYDAENKTTGDAYLIIKKDISNFDFIDEDTFELKLMETSFRSPDYFERQLSRKLSNYNGYPCLDVQEKMKDSSIVTARYLIKGPHYFVLAARSSKPAANSDFFSSFSFTPNRYYSRQTFADTFMHFTVNSAVVPKIDSGYRAILEKVANAAKNNYFAGNAYLPNNTSAMFLSDSTGEMILVQVQKMQEYYYSKDSASFWKKQLDIFSTENSMVISGKQSFTAPGNIQGYRISLRDTGSSRQINTLLLLRNTYLFTVSSLGDTLQQQSNFMDHFFSSFTADPQTGKRSIYDNPVDSFFTHLFSSDSATLARAQQAINFVNFGEEGVPRIMDALKKLTPAYKNYFDVKTKLIAELGYISDTTKAVVADHLEWLYQQTADTSMFQNEIIEALSHHRTRAATQLFKELVLQDPPVYDDTYTYEELFSNFSDSLQLAAQLFPDILQLTTLQDYKTPVMDLLVTLVDSGTIQPAQYEQWFQKIFFDAKIALKKQKGSDEKRMKAEMKKKDDDTGADEDMDEEEGEDFSNELNSYAVLLVPFYEQNTSVQKFFDKLLQSRNEDVKMNTAIRLLKNNRPVADSVLQQLAADDKTRGALYARLEAIHRTEKFPAAYKTQELLARSYLLNDKAYVKADSIVFIGKQPAGYKNRTGMVYFFKYRLKKDDDWKIGISGLQPAAETEVSSDDRLVRMTDKKLKEEKPLAEQLQEQLTKILFNYHPSARYFFDTYNYGFRY